MNLKHILLLAAISYPSFLCADNNKPLFKYDNKPYSKADLSPAARQNFFDSERMKFENDKRIIEDFILERYVQDQSKKSKKPLQAVEAELFQMKPVTDADAQKWFDSNKESLGGRDFQSIKREIINLLSKQQQEKTREALVAKIKKETGFNLLLEEPKAPSVDISYKGYPTKGADKAKVTIVEFADYGCPHCKKATLALKTVIDKYRDKVKLVYLDFPLSSHSSSKTIAEGGFCADKQNKFWEYHYMAFENQGKHSNDSPMSYAKDLKLNVDQFKKCLGSQEAKQRVELARTEGERIGVQSTPSIYINGIRHMGYSEESLELEIKKYL